MLTLGSSSSMGTMARNTPSETLRWLEAMAAGRKALMLGVSIIENGIGGEASIAGMR